MKIVDLMIQLIGGDLSEGDERTLRKIGILIMWRMSFVVFMVFSLGGLTFLGLTGFVRAAELEQKIGPVNSAISQLAASLKALSDSQKEQTLALLRVAITDGLVKRCHADKDETRRIYRAQVDEAQTRYYSLTGSYYPEHACADL